MSCGEPAEDNFVGLVLLFDLHIKFKLPSLSGKHLDL